MFGLRDYRLGATMFAAFLFVLSRFVGQEVYGGVEGGRFVGTERRGTAIVSLYQGGRQVIYAAAADKGRALALIAGMALLLVLALIAFELVRRKPSVREIPGDTFGAILGGALIGWMTTMPLALLLKSASLPVFWIVMIPSLVVVFFLMCFIAAWAVRHT